MINSNGDSTARYKVVFSDLNLLLKLCRLFWLRLLISRHYVIARDHHSHRNSTRTVVTQRSTRRKISSPVESPIGVGYVRDPPVYLHPGDQVMCSKPVGWKSGMAGNTKTRNVLFCFMDPKHKIQPKMVECIAESADFHFQTRLESFPWSIPAFLFKRWR